jgi:hypothetical protein
MPGATPSPYIMRRVEALTCDAHASARVTVTVGELRQLLRHAEGGVLSAALGEAILDAWRETEMLHTELKLTREQLAVARELVSRLRAEVRASRQRERVAKDKLLKFRDLARGLQRAVGRIYT